MYEIMMALQLIKSANPYLRKHALNTLDTHDLLFVQATIIFLLTSTYFVYVVLHEPKMPRKAWNRYCQLTVDQHLAIVFIAGVTVVSGAYVLELDKHHRTPLVNHLFMKVVSVVIMFVIGVVLFQETYTSMQVVGLIFAISGLIMLLSE